MFTLFEHFCLEFNIFTVCKQNTVTEIVHFENTELSYLSFKIYVIDMFTGKQRKHKIAKESERNVSEKKRRYCTTP